MLRHQVDQRGGFLLLGNTQGYDCAAGVPAPVVGTIGNCGINTADTAADIFVRSDDPNHNALADLSITNPMARTTAILPLPSGATVTYARIYWSAENVDASIDTNILVERPGGSSQVVSADASWTQTMNSLYFYGAAADITPFVQTQGAGPLRVSGIDSVALANLSDNSSYVVWAMVVLYRDPNMPMQNLAVFDGFDLVQNGAAYTGSIHGFTVPASGYTASLGIVAYEGDDALTGDTFSFNGTPLSNALNPVNNFLNGTHSYNGVAVSQVGDLPQLSGAPGSVSGLDLDVVDITAQVAAGDTTASLVSTTSSDTYLFGVFTTAISTLYPDLSNISKGVTHLTASTAIRVGDHLHVHLTFSNTGSDTAVDVVLRDPLAAGLDYVPGSLAITGGAGAGPKTDAAGDDQAEYDAASHTVIFRLGAGADATTGGNITTSDAATTVDFDIAINPACGITVDNQGVVSCRGQLSLLSHPQPTQYPSANGADANTPVTVVVDSCAGPGDCPAGASACLTTTHPFMCVPCSNDAECPTARPTCDSQTGSCVACTQDNDCAANQFCARQACVPRTPSGQAPPTGTCTTTTSACQTGQCDTSTGLCGAPASQPCGASNDCASLVCASDRRCGLFNGQSCEQDTSCRAQACGSDGLCGKVDGQGCSAADVCRSSVCNADTAVCSACNDASDCPGGALCAGGACVAPPDVERLAGGSLGCSAGGKPDIVLLLLIAAMLSWRRRRLAIAGVLLVMIPVPRTAQARNMGYAVQRYVPSTTQDWTFRVERPWYRERWQDVAVGLTLDYSHNPLLLTAVTPQDDIIASQGIIAHALFGHLQLATSWIDRLTVLAEMPVLLAQSAHSAAGITPTAAVAFADPRLGARIRLWNHPEVDSISLHIAGDLWIPVRGESTVGDRAPRGLVRAIAGGVLFDHMLWTASAGMLARPTAELSTLPVLQPQTTGAELQFGAALGFTNTQRTWHVGPEFTYDTTVNQSHAFTSQASTIEALLGAQASVTCTVRVGAAVGTALLREPGTPDLRAMARVSWQPCDAPTVDDHDADGIPDTQDRCPIEPQGATPDPNLPGCPLRDRDGDGMLDNQDLCPDVPAGMHPDPKRPGCPLSDTDGDGILDVDDACPTVPGVASTDPNENGCPQKAAAPEPPAPPPLERLAVPPIHFELNRARLLPESDAALKIALDALEHRADMRVSIEGHTDNTGAEDYNVGLSKRRAQAVVKWLVDHHVDPARLQSDGFGPQRPVADNATLQGRRTNRRVEFVVQSSKRTP